MTLPDWLLHRFGRCNYDPRRQAEDLILARSDMDMRLRNIGADADTVGFTRRMIRSSQKRLRYHEIDWTEYPDRPAVRQED